MRQRDQFDQFWAAYPRKEGKKKAWEKWQKLDPDPALFAAILSGLDAHFLGSVSRQIVNFAACTVTVVH